MRNKLHIKIGDNVMVVAGNEKGNSGKVLSFNAKRDRALVEGLNMMMNLCHITGEIMID